MSQSPLFAKVPITSIAAGGKWALNGGPFGSKLVSKMYVEAGVPVIRGTNLPFEKRFLDEGFVFVSDEKARELRAHTAKPGDVIFTQRGTLGQVGIIPLTAKYPLYVISQSQMKLTVNAEMADPFFVYYVFRTPSVVASFVGLASTSGVPHVNLQTLRDFEIPLPPLETQCRIAAIIGAYDDLIEVNRRRVAVLEEMARGLFEEWFVRFRFPGHETVPILDTTDGPLPEGWRWGELGEQLALAYGKALKATERKPGPVPVIGSSGIVGEHCEAYEAGPGIVVGRKGNVGSIVWSPKDFWPIDTVYFVRSAVPQMYLLQLLRLVPFQNTDAAVPGLNRSAALKQVIRIPSADLPRSYHDIVWPMRQMVDQLTQVNERLAASRDLLLPRLMSGQLSVAAAERELELA